MSHGIGVLALLAGLAACDDYLLPPAEVDEDRVDTILALTGEITAGESAFEEHCAICHDPAGFESRAGPALAGLVGERTDRQLVAVMLEGLGTMPAVDLTDPEAADLVAFMRDRFDEVPDDSDAGADTGDPADTGAPPDTGSDTDAPADTGA